MRWTVLVPLRGMPGAKTRLARDISADLHAELVAAIRADTLAAVRAAAPVARVIVVGDAPGPGVALVQHSPGLNGALRDGWEFATRRWPDDGVAALVGDLPALRAAELTATLGRAGALARGYVADADGTGTTLLTVTRKTGLDPRFGPGSAARHAASGGVALAAGPGLRQDVDTAGDLAAAGRLGVGEHTAAIIGSPNTAARSPSRGMMSM